MSRSTPYLQRRGHTFSFRIDVPAPLREVVGLREITKTLQTEERSRAQPLALEMGAVSKRLFSELRLSMNDKKRMIGLLQDARVRLALNVQAEAHQDELETLHLAHNKEVLASRHLAELTEENRLLKRAQDGPLVDQAPRVAPAPSRVVAARSDAQDVTLGTVVGKFLATPLQQKKLAMFKKHKTVLPLLIASVGSAKLCWRRPKIDPPVE